MNVFPVYQKSTQKASNSWHRRELEAFHILGRLPEVYQFHFLHKNARFLVRFLLFCNTFTELHTSHMTLWAHVGEIEFLLPVTPGQAGSTPAKSSIEFRFLVKSALFYCVFPRRLSRNKAHPPKNRFHIHEENAPMWDVFITPAPPGPEVRTQERPSLIKAQRPVGLKNPYRRKTG